MNAIPAHAGFLGRSGRLRFVSIGRFTQNHQTHAYDSRNKSKVTGVTKQALVTIPIRISFGHGILPCRVQIAGRVRPTDRWHSAGEFFCRLPRALSIVVGHQKNTKLR